MIWRARQRTFTFGPRPMVMGILNVTPDSFSDGGQFFHRDAAIQQGLRFVSEGADLIDIGGESSRPGARPVTLDEELFRVVPVVRELAMRANVLISVDTTKAEVARQALDAGACIINDISAGLGDAAMLNVVRDAQAGFVLMHMQGMPETMQRDPTYTNVTLEVRDFLNERMQACLAAGISFECLALDPGIGFGKTFEHTLTQLCELPSLLELKRPIVLGVSRKGFIGQITGRGRDARVAGSLAVAAHAVAHGAAHVLRVHDVPETVDLANIMAHLIPQRL